MALLLVSFIAGILTVLAPCVLPLLPIIIGGSVQGQGKRNPYVITASLALAIVLFTLLLKFSTILVNIPPMVWSSISGVIIVVFGLISLFPGLWERVNVALGLSNRSDKLLADSARVPNRWSDVLMGMSLGPVFSSCSPTYFLILATVLPRSFASGLIYLAAYAVGLSLMLLLVSVLGQRFIRRAGWAADPRGWFKRGLGVLFLIVGVLILTGADKTLQSYLLAKGFYPTAQLEQSLLEKTRPGVGRSEAQLGDTTKNFPRYREISQPSGFVNTDPLTIGQLVGKKVILVDFMTYSCINCIRTFPFLNAWYDKYKDQGLEIVGIHTPEFAFEHKLDNVKAAMQRFGIKFPVVLDNDYGTWNAFGNSYWPRKYLIDLDGYIVYDHIGEGGYDETEKKIQELLAEKAKRDKTVMPATGLVSVDAATPAAQLSPETYFGSARNEYLVNGIAGQAGEQTLVEPKSVEENELNLSGTWRFRSEAAENTSKTAKVIYRYQAKDVFLVASAVSSVQATVWRDGQPLPRAVAGKDITFDKTGMAQVTINEERLYDLVHDSAVGEHTLEIRIEGPGVQAYTFTFG